MVLMTLLAQAATIAQDSLMSLTEVGTEEGMNVLELAVKGGWIMVVLALLSILGIYIFIIMTEPMIGISRFLTGV